MILTMAWQTNLHGIQTQSLFATRTKCKRWREAFPWRLNGLSQKRMFRFTAYAMKALSSKSLINGTAHMSFNKLVRVCACDTYALLQYSSAGRGRTFPVIRTVPIKDDTSSPYFHLIPLTLGTTEFGLHLMNLLKLLSWNSPVAS